MRARSPRGLGDLAAAITTAIPHGWPGVVEPAGGTIPSLVLLRGAAVLIRGETGTGKELIASAIHELSARRGPFLPINCGALPRNLPINCGALPRNLIESELFGHERGAFSGASEKREGLVRRAHGGTLFLDEIAELPEESQVTLLRVL